MTCFLKCSHCGQLNEVKSEYLVFCSNCGKKLGNNFSDWKKRNPEKTLDDFKQLICISDDEIQRANVPVKKAPSRGLKFWIGFTVSFAIFYAIGQFWGEAIVKYFKSEKTAKEVLDQKWIKAAYGDEGLMVETPVKLTKADLPFPDEVRKMIEKADSYNSMTAKGFKIMINSIKYVKAVGSINLQGVANGSVNEVKLEEGVTNFTYTEEYVYKGDIPGFIQKGTFEKNGIKVKFINSGFASGLNLWQVFVAYQSNDEIGRIASKRVIESIEIKKTKAL